MRSVVGLFLLAIASSVAVGSPAEMVARLGSDRPEIRAAAREGLILAAREALPALREGLRSGSPVAALGCADLLGAGGYREARPELREILANADAPLLLRRACALALGRAGDYRDVKLLGGLLPGMGEAALALAEIGESDGLAALPPATADLPEVAYARVVLGDGLAMGALLDALGGPRRLTALHLLRRASGEDLGEDEAAWRTWWRREGMARALGAEDWGVSEAALARVLEGDSPEVRGDLFAVAEDVRRSRNQRTKAILALGELGAAEMAHGMLAILTGDADGMVRLYAAEALGRMGRREMAVDLAYYLVFDVENFRGDSEKGRYEAYFTIDSEVCKTLVKMGVKGGLDFLIRQLSEEHRVRVYHQALITLREATGQNFDYRPDASKEERKRAAGRWRKWFDEHREDLSLGVPERIPGAGFEGRMEGLVETLGHFKFLAMSRARETLTLLGEVALPWLRGGLSRPESHVKVHCSQILGRIHAKSVRSEIAVLLEDPRPEVRSAAVAALGRMGPGPASVRVVKALQDESPDVRIEAATAMARVERGLALPALARAAMRKENDLDAFRREMAWAMAALGERDGVDRLEKLLDHTDVAFRQSVAGRLRELTGRDPGTEWEGILAFREWWRVNRDRYSPFTQNEAPR